MAIQPQSVAHRMGHLHIIGLITNKWIKAPTDAQPLQQIVRQLLDSIFEADPKEFSEPVGEKLRIAFWICKALVLKGDKFGMEVTGRLLELLGNPAYGATASKGFAALLGEDDFLNKENYAVVRLLTKQKIFAFCVPKIVGGFRGASSGIISGWMNIPNRWLMNVSRSREAKLPRRSLQHPLQRSLHSYPHRVARYPSSPSAVS